MQVNAAPQIPRTPPAGEPAAPESGCGDSFANLLNQQQPAPADEATSEPPTDAADAQDRSARARGPNRSASRGPARDAQAQATRRSDAAATRDAAAAEAEHDEDITATVDPALHDWLAALHLPAPATAAAGVPAPPAGKTDTNDTLAVDDSGLAAAATARASPGAAQAGGTPRAAARDKGDTPASRAPGPASGLRSDDAASAATSAERPSTSGTRFAEVLAGARGASADPLATPTAPPLPQAGSAADTSTPAPVALTTPTDDPQFPRAFGVQVSLLARDGIQQAELQLNPAEMGPVSVQIVMEGTQARIDFGADAAATRDLIEHSLPELAAALREAGLTLSGGGVSQHPQGRQASAQAGDGPPGEHRPGAPPASTAAPQPQRRHVRAGGIDLYA